MKQNGWLFIDKPVGISSFDVIRQIRKTLGVRKCGHTGTLDPLASGVLIVAVGEACKLIPYLEANRKEYTYRVMWGQERSTDDAEGEVTATSDVRPTRHQTEQALVQLVGEVTQVPPVYSACKVNGKRAYAYARSGQDVQLKPRQVLVDSQQIVEWQDDWVDLNVICGPGVYVRALGRDLARSLKACAYVTCLQRQAVGEVRRAQCCDLDSLSVQKLRPIYDLLPFPSVDFGEDEVGLLSQGQAVSRTSLGEERIIARNAENCTVAIVCFAQGDLWIPKRVLHLI